MSRINSDLMNLVGSVQIAIVIVSTDLRIRRFTPMAEKVLNLIPADLDRSIGHINPNIDCPNLEQLIVECMDTVTPLEREVRDRQGRWYALRIRPYKSLDNKIDGAVLALFDVDILKRAERKSALAQELAEMVVQSARAPMALLGADLEVRLANPAFAALLGAAADELRGRTLTEAGGAGWKLDGWREAAKGAPGSVLPAVMIAPGKPARWTGSLELAGRVALSPDSETPVVLVSAAIGGGS
jgi:two-component system CheB/CheR fusion protein